MLLTLIRDTFSPTFTLGSLFADGEKIGETCEDTDRRLEDGVAVKVPKKTAIPRGRYRVILNRSARFGKVMPLVVGVPHFSGIRFHGGNTAEDTDGCPLLGSVRTPHGVRDCPGPNARLIALLEQAESRNEPVWLEVK